MKIAALLALLLFPLPAAAGTGSWIFLRVKMLSEGPLQSSKVLDAIRKAGGEPLHWSARDGWYGVYDVGIDNVYRPQFETSMWNLGADSVLALSEPMSDATYQTRRNTPIKPYLLYMYFHVDPKVMDAKSVGEALAGGFITDSKPDEGRYWALVQSERTFDRSLAALPSLDDVRLVGLRPMREGIIKAVGDRPSIRQDLLGALDTCHVKGRSMLQIADAPQGRLAFEAVIYDEDMTTLRENERICVAAFKLVAGILDVDAATTGSDADLPDDLKGVIPPTLQEVKSKSNSVYVYMDPTVSTGDAAGLFEKHGGKLLRIAEPGIYVVGTEPGQDGRFIDEIKKEDSVSLAVPNAAPHSDK